VDQGRVVKGVRFQGLRAVGDPVKAASIYEMQGADEIVFLDVSASSQGRETMVDIVKETASVLTIPLTVGGGVRSADDVIRLLRSGADKVAINTAAVSKPEIIHEAKEVFGSQCVVLAIDAKQADGSWQVFTRGGREKTGLDVLAWAEEGQKLGAGEFLVTSMDRDGTQNGYDLGLYRALRKRVRRPIIASGGCGSPDHVLQVLQDGIADAALLASVLHDKLLTIEQIKQFLRDSGVTVRLS
jgi:imidazole glycerol-phosphate synthase subunit HisF